MKHQNPFFSRLCGGLCILLMLSLLLCSCDMEDMEGLVFSLVREAPGSKTVTVLETTPGEVIDPNGNTTGNKNHILVMEDGHAVRLTTMRVIADAMPVYAEDSTDSAVVKHYRLSSLVTVEITNDSMWKVYEGEQLTGYCEIDKVLYEDAVYYGELPMETAAVYDAEEDRYRRLTSHLVDVSKYNDLLQTQMIINMTFSAEENTGNTPTLYQRNLCMLQYDTLMKLLKAQAHFIKYGYTIKIYDAYRPETVQNQFADAVGDENWEAHTDGAGSAHTRGTAVDITVVNIETGVEVELPSPLYTFDTVSARFFSENWTTGAAYNVNSLMNPIMTQAGFESGNVWWHYEDSDSGSYLSTDHAIDSIPLVSAD